MGSQRFGHDWATKLSLSYIYLYKILNHCAINLKLTQYCKPTILQQRSSFNFKKMTSQFLLSIVSQNATKSLYMHTFYMFQLINIPFKSTRRVLYLYFCIQINFFKDTCTPIFIEVLLITAKTWKQPKKLLGRMDKENVVYTHTNTRTPWTTTQL